MLFSSICVGAYAVGEEQQTEETLTDAERIVLTDDELKEKFGIEQILLPEGFEPFAYVYYDGSYGFVEYPEYITAVFNNGTTVEVKTGAETYEGGLKIKAYCHYMDGLNLYIFITKDSSCDSFVFLSDSKCESLSFSENYNRYKQNISYYYDGFIHCKDPKDVFVLDDYIGYTGNSTIDSELNIIRRHLDYTLPEFLMDVVMETAQFLNWCFKDAISFS